MMRGCGGRMGLFLNISLPPNASTANASTSPSEVSTFGHSQRSSGHVGVAEAHISAHHASSAIGEMLVQPWRGSPTWFCLRTACCLATGTAGGAIVDRSIMVPSALGGEQALSLSPRRLPIAAIRRVKKCGTSFTRPPAAELSDNVCSLHHPVALPES